MRLMIAAALLIGFSGEALAQECPRPAGWAKPARHVAAKASQMRFALKPNGSAQLQLHPQRTVKLATKAKNGKTSAQAGLAALDVAKAGRLEVLLSDRAYVDLVRGGRALDSSSHRRVNCGGIFKSVSFNVTPGRYVVQLTDAEARSIRMATITR